MLRTGQLIFRKCSSGRVPDDFPPGPLLRLFSSARAAVGVGGDQGDAGQATGGQVAEEPQPPGAVLGAEQPDVLASTRSPGDGCREQCDAFIDLMVGQVPVAEYQPLPMLLAAAVSFQVRDPDAQLERVTADSLAVRLGA